MLKSNICSYNDAYILVRDDTTIIGHNLPTEVDLCTFHCAPFISLSVSQKLMEQQ